MCTDRAVFSIKFEAQTASPSQNFVRKTLTRCCDRCDYSVFLLFLLVRLVSDVTTSFVCTSSEDHRWLRATFQCLRWRSNQWRFFTRVEVDLTRCEAAPLARPQEPMCFSASFRVLWTSGLLCVRVAPPPPVGVRDEDDTFLISSVCIFFLYSRTAVFCVVQSRKSRGTTPIVNGRDPPTRGLRDRMLVSSNICVIARIRDAWGSAGDTHQGGSVLAC